MHRATEGTETSPDEPESRPDVLPTERGIQDKRASEMEVDRPKKEPRRAPRPGDRQRDAERTRGRLLAAALDEFASKGFAGARVQDIADRAGVHKQLITYYFGGKEGLYQELQASWRRRESAFNQPDVPLQELVVRYLDDALADPRLTRLLVWRGLTEAADQEATSGADDLSGINARQDHGELDADLDPGSVMLALIGAVTAAVTMPQLVHRLCDMDPSDPAFARRYGEQLRLIVAKLAATPSTATAGGSDTPS